MHHNTDFKLLKSQIITWANDLGFQDIKVSDTQLKDAATAHQHWIAKGYHGDMYYLAENLDLRASPEKLKPGTLRVLSVRLNYLPEDAKFSQVLSDPNKAIISRYALGRDYHKLMRKRLDKLAKRISQAINTHDYRVFVDSAPVLERVIAQKSGLGWIGKNTLLINKNAGSWFFLGEIFTNLPLPLDAPVEDACGACRACLDICPTQAFTGPYELNATRCISYLTIEHHGSIPMELRHAIGNRIYGCDDCQLVCPWNRFSSLTEEKDFQPRHSLDWINLLDLFGWTEEEFLNNFSGNSIRRIGYERWQRNLAVALGNAPTSDVIIEALKKQVGQVSALVDEHLHWAIDQQTTTNRQTRNMQHPYKLIRTVQKMHPRDA